MKYFSKYHWYSEELCEVKHNIFEVIRDIISDKIGLGYCYTDWTYSLKGFDVKSIYNAVTE